MEGQVVGAIGVSGVKSEQDAQVAKAGLLPCRPWGSTTAQHLKTFPTPPSEAPYLLPLPTENMIGTGGRKVAIQRRLRMHPYARPIAELRSSLREMLAHDMTNPDNDPHLSGSCSSAPPMNIPGN